MKRYLVIVCALGLALGLGLPSLRSGPTTAQDQTEERLTALETQVAELESRVEVLEGSIEATAEESGSGVATGNADAIVVSGVGAVVTEDFQLEAGRYQVTLELASGCCIGVTLYEPSGNEESLFIEIFGLDATNSTSETIYEAPETGIYFINAENLEAGAAWTVTFEKR